MKRPSISRKPTKAHIVWTSDDDKGVKRFDENHLRKWCNHYGFDFERYTRVDHDRSDEPRTQYQCVFSYQRGAGDSFSMGDREWSIQTNKTPKTFIEIDEEGMLRVQGWSTNRVIDIESLWHKGSALLIRSADGDKDLKLDAKDLTR